MSSKEVRQIPWARSTLFVLCLCFFSLPGFSQIPKDVLVQEVAGCAERRGNGSLDNDPQPYQPCRTPPINTLLIREFADGVFGFYADYSQFATTQSNCTVMGLGRQKGRSIVGALYDFERKELTELCKVSLTWNNAKPKGFSGFAFQELSVCSGMCGMNNNVGSISFGGNAGFSFTPSFNCSKANQPAEQLVCLDWDLSKLDFRVAELWQHAGEGAGEKQKQASWLKERNSCKYDANCISLSYQRRVKELCVSAGLKLNDKGQC